MANWVKRTNAQKQRAKRYRARVREGADPLTLAEQAWFDRYEAGLDLEIDTPGKESDSDSNQDVPDELEDPGVSPVEPIPPHDAAPVAGTPGPDVVPDVPPPPPAPPPPPPPRVAPPRAPKAPPLPPPPRSIKAESSGDGTWQSKYWPEAVGREGTCKLIADHVYTILHHMQNQCRDVGVDPIIDLEKVNGCFVIAIDKVLPPEFTITPEAVAAAATASTVTQRWMHRKKIAEAQKNVAERKTADERKATAEQDRIAAERKAAEQRYKDQQAAAAAAVPIEKVKVTPAPAPAPPEVNHSVVGTRDEDRLA